MGALGYATYKIATQGASATSNTNSNNSSGGAVITPGTGGDECTSCECITDKIRCKTTESCGWGKSSIDSTEKCRSCLYSEPRDNVCFDNEEDYNDYEETYYPSHKFETATYTIKKADVCYHDNVKNQIIFSISRPRYIQAIIGSIYLKGTKSMVGFGAVVKCKCTLKILPRW